MRTPKPVLRLEKILARRCIQLDCSKKSLDALGSSQSVTEFLVQVSSKNALHTHSQVACAIAAEFVGLSDTRFVVGACKTTFCCVLESDPEYTLMFLARCNVADARAPGLRVHSFVQSPGHKGLVGKNHGSRPAHCGSREWPACRRLHAGGSCETRVHEPHVHVQRTYQVRVLDAGV